MSVSAVGAVATSMPRTYFFLKKKRKLLRHRLSRQHDKHSTVEDNGDVDENKSSDSEQDQLKFHLRKSESTTCVNTNDTVWNTFRCQHDLIKCPLCELSAAKTSRAVKSAAECNKIGYRRGCCAFADKYKDDCQNLIKTTKLAATICISHISCAATLASATSPTSNLSNCSCPKMQKCVQPTASKERKRTSPSWVPINKVPLSPRTHLGTTFITKLKIFDCRTNDNQILSIKATKQRPIKAAASSAKTALFANTLKVFQMFVLLLRMQKLLSFKTKGRQPPSLLSHQQKPSSALLRLTLIRNFETPVTSHTHHQQVQLQRHTAAKQRQHLQHIHLNCSVLYIVLIILSLMSLTMPATRAETSPQRVPLMSNENVCKSMDIRNTPSEFSQLRNCTVIEGFLLIVLLNTNNQAEFNESFPLLTEVTEFVIIYRVHYLRSLAQILPNLSVIRGRELFGGYALTIYSNPQLEELGLSNLIAISRGGVRIENNFSLCFVKTIDWSKLVTNTTDIRIEKNRPDIECPQCPGSLRYGGDEVVSAENDVVCKERQGRRFCWNSKTCQKFCPESCRDNCLDEHTCCNESCLGGCASNNLSVCNNCRRYTSNNTCIDVCPHGYYTYLDRRCITAEACTGSKFENNKQEQLVPYNGACSTRCPNGYNKLSGTCQFCGDKCQKLCPGGLIDSVERAKEYHGCTHITENGLTISISRGGRHLMEDLEFGLSSIKVIETYLKVHRTYGMFSLEYFKNLKEIKGKILCEDRFALYVLENNDLEGIWQPNQMVRIEEGRVFFHFNPKLCVSVIMALRPMLKHNATFDKNEVATDSNGSKGSCNTEFLNITIFKISHTMAIVDIVNPLVFEDDRTFIGYQYFYMEDKYKNATKHSNRPCDDVWMADEPTKETRHVYTSLKPFTQYAYYVKTMTISSEPRNAQSPIQYFKTKSAQPENVRIISSYANSSSEIVVTWLPPTHVYGHLTKYKLRAVLAPKNLEKESRNYCKDPLKEAAKIDQPMPHQATEKPAPNDCKCSKDGKGSGYDDEISDANIHDSIDFENMIQNFVYVKNSIRVYAPSKIPVIIPDVESGNTQHHRQRRSEIGDFDSFLLRHMRSLPAELNDNKSGTAAAPVQTATKSLLSDNDSNSYPNNSTRLDPSGRYFTVLVDEVNDTTTEFVFQNLKHFSVYELSVEACREPEEGATLKECSDVLPIYVRTMKRDDVDKVRNLRVKFENSNTTRSSIRLFWDPPESPNAAVVSYTISYEHQAQDAVEEKKCITELDYQNLTNGYTIFGLPTGNYSIRVRANSLAGEGVYSKYVYIYIPPTQLSSTVIAIICATVLSFLGLTVGFVVYLRKKILEPPSDLKMFPTVNPYYISMQYIPDDWEVPRERIIQLSALGQGSFGMVYEGILKGYNSSTEDTPCAIKTVNENATDRERMNFLNEASVMKQFDTYHVVRLLGVCSRGQPALVIMELMKNGDLKSYLRAHRPDEREDAMLRLMEVKVQPPPLSRIYQMAIEIADGMAYLAAKKFVHRDLAARNCMVASDLTVKIGDFGMTRDIYETDYYRKGTKGLLPVRWMPPESLRDGIYSTASDVFSYGVVLWEMATLASQPYQGLSNDQVLRYVIDGGIMERPENCPDKLYRLMQKCWHHRPTARPSFMEIIEILLEHANSHFTEVSFYHSEDGQVARNKEIQEKMHQSIDEFKDNENDMDDVTTPLRVGEYNEYKLNIDISSIENQNESPTITDLPHTHSPYSHGSANINNSTPGNPTLSSAPSTSAGIVSSSNFACRLHQSLQHHVPARLPLLSHSDEAAYVQPDYEPRDLTEEDEIRIARDISKGTDTDEFGYQLYDPSPTYGKHHTSCGPESAVSAQNLLPKQRNRQRLLASMSSSMPDEAVNTPMSSLQPSFYSAASSNISSNATSGNVGGVGKCPTLKKAISETVQSVGISLPQRLRNMNLIFLHKRSGSNTSRKSCGSNPNSVSSNSNLSSTRGSDGMSGQRNSVSGSNLNTIESGENAGSYAPTTPLFLKRDNPNYKLLDESIGSLGVSVVDGGTGGSIHPQPNSAVITTYKPRSGFNSNIQHSYKVLNESLNTSDSPKLSIGVSENPTHELLLRPPTTNDNPNYVMMSEPQASTELQGAGTSFQTGNFIGSQKPLEYNEDEVLTEGMDLEHISLYPSRSVDPFRLRDRRESINQSRSRGRSQGRIQEVEDATSASTSKSAGHQLKEKWLQHQQNQNRLPPSNGLIGRDS